MAQATNIEWCDRVWNPVLGCTRVSRGCDNCYAIAHAHRFDQPGRAFEGLTVVRQGRVDFSGLVKLEAKALTAPLHWKKPQRIFVNSMSDLFHHGVPDDYIDKVFAVMALCPQHTFQILTKRPELMRDYFESLRRASAIRRGEATMDWLLSVVPRNQAEAIVDAPFATGLPNVWLGVSVEDQKTADERIPHLLQTPAAVRWISAEPLLGPVDLTQCGTAEPEEWYCQKCERYVGSAGVRFDETHDNCGGQCGPGPIELDWVVVGGESGPKARPFNIEWARSIVQQCREANVACFVKQLGAKAYESPDRDGATGFYLPLSDKKGGNMEEWPEDLRVREFPTT